MTADPWDANFNYSTGELLADAAVLTFASAESMVTDIQADITRSPQNDPPLLPQLVTKALTELQAAATQESGPLSAWAAWLLEALWHRSQSGVPFGEPCEPAWSLDPEPWHPTVKDRS